MTRASIRIRSFDDALEDFRKTFKALQAGKRGGLIKLMEARNRDNRRVKVPEVLVGEIALKIGIK